jgi:hypothetical protein
VHPQTFATGGLPPPQVCGSVQLPQLTVPPHPSGTESQFFPAHAVILVFGVHPQLPATPAPPHVLPIPGHVVEHCTVWPQLLPVGPHLPFAQVVDMGSSVHALHCPVVEPHPNMQAMSAPHWPSAPHVCEAVPLQRKAPGEHTPPHRPVFESQMFEQVVPAS